LRLRYAASSALGATGYLRKRFGHGKHAPATRHTRPSPRAAPHRYDEQTDVQALLEENAQLRELVIQLSKLVIKNVVDRK
jgi:hypothetical protein